jgi:hypothetical protein
MLLQNVLDSRTLLINKKQKVAINNCHFFLSWNMDHVIIIGAGPAGLACAGALRQKNIPFTILEKSNHVANAWINHYDRLSLHTIKELSQLPHLPFPKHYPTYIPKNQLLEYYKTYCTKFDISPQFGSEVTDIKDDNKEWLISCSNGKSYRGKTVVVCTGFNRTPKVPSLDGINKFKGSVIHSKDYKNPAQLNGDSVLVVGMGNSGAEIALDLSLAEKKTDLSVRGPVNIVPRDFLGNPTQKTAKKLAILPTFLGDRIGRLVQIISMGNLNKYGLKRANLFPAQQLREYGKTPVIDLGTVEQIKKGSIKVNGEIDKILEEHVLFKNGTTKKYDHIIFATGYDSSVERFAPFAKDHLNEHGHPDKLYLDFNNNKRACFVGFNAYASGILESIHNQSIELAELLGNPQN